MSKRSSIASIAISNMRSFGVVKGITYNPNAVHVALEDMTLTAVTCMGDFQMSKYATISIDIELTDDELAYFTKIANEYAAVESARNRGELFFEPTGGEIKI